LHGLAELVRLCFATAIFLARVTIATPRAVKVAVCSAVSFFIRSTIDFLSAISFCYRCIPTGTFSGLALVLFLSWSVARGIAFYKSLQRESQRPSLL
jgi:hypothetical protein